LWLLAPTILAALSLGFMPPTESSSERIVFLNLTLVDGEAHLNDIVVVSGHLKHRKTIRLLHNHFYYKVTSASGETLYEATVPDPSILRVEYADEEGRLQMRTAKQEIADFSIRFPFNPDAHRVTIRRIDSAIPDIRRLTENTVMVGSFEIDLAEDDRP
ncbi:MAG: hypothetical protein JSW50_11505, partial [Candidatus Latescibacterota bacterium]